LLGSTSGGIAANVIAEMLLAGSGLSPVRRVNPEQPNFTQVLTTDAVPVDDP
jgi:hypothetical protein